MLLLLRCTLSLETQMCNCTRQYLSCGSWHTGLGHAGVCIAVTIISLLRQQAFLAGCTCSELLFHLLYPWSWLLWPLTEQFWQQQGTDAQLGNEFLKWWHLGVSLPSSWSLAGFLALLATQELGSVFVACWPSQKSACLWLVPLKELRAFFIHNFESKIILETLMKFTQKLLWNDI